MTDAQELAAPDAPPRRSTRWLGAMSAVFALAIVFGGTDLVTEVSAPSGRIFVIVALAAAFLLFALLGVGGLPRSSNQPAIAGIGVVMLGVALVVSWSAPDDLPDPARIATTSNESVCGDITHMDHDFVAVTDQMETRSWGPDGQPQVTHKRTFVPIASIRSITSVDHC
ncbi:hypothetical protein Daura_01470 [Dactylosporangium aurantiacum]|uniref:Uncharacterized protein n=1 Tax=Dactylosporangium aurantiacum TaxID=35754 RepID=A0A9Q9MHL6_9ACTN|nr:hypothetical protein [Dactylosporangium aurantiacum]MDG6100965.1 hypothetical protein [Dactylosporangium aurantiacum]UWZ54985.1 hypothetical protein Daura_01470 [Dactylosporangium aurantiacum]